MARQFLEPLVSVIVVNWNYAEFVEQAIQSVKNQTYSNIECIVVDNASNDDSVAKILAATGGNPRFRLIQNSENLGHLGGGLIGLDAARGTFVAFLDADDYYFPEFIASHVQVHMSSLRHTAVTSSGVVTIDEANRAIGGNFRGAEPQNKKFTPNLPLKNHYPVSGVDEAHYTALRESTLFGNWDITYWFWVGGSPNLIRRDMLELLRPPKGSEVPLGGVDAYFHIPAHALTGTTVIDVPLSAYRMHGRNDFLRMPSMNGMTNGSDAVKMRNTLVKKVAIRRFAEQTEEIVGLVSSRYFLALRLITRRSNAVDSPTLKYPHVFADPVLQRRLANNFGMLVRAFGLPTALGGLWWSMGTFYLIKTVALSVFMSLFRR